MPVQAQSTTALNSETAVTVSDTNTNTNYALPEPHCDVLAAACEQLSIG